MTNSRTVCGFATDESRLGLGLIAGSLLFSALYVGGCSSEFHSCTVTRTCPARGGSGGSGGSEAGDGGETSEAPGTGGTTSNPGSGPAGAAGESEEAGSGSSVDACTGKVCEAPPDNGCESASKFKAYDKIGSCSNGTCSYTAHDISCTCSNGACTSDPCIGVTCSLPPAPKCLDADTLTKYASAGTCSVGSCSYGSIDVPCSFGCANGACKSDPCAGVTCNTQKAPTCKDTTTVETYASSGVCSQGACSYAPTDTGCGANKACGGAGVCAVCKSDASCGDSCGACGGDTPKCKDLGTTSQCVGCISDADCGLGACDSTINSCQANPVGCNTFALTGAVIHPTNGTSGQLPAGTRGTIIPGTYLLTGVTGYGDVEDPQRETIVISVSGNNVTLNSYLHDVSPSPGLIAGPLRSTGTFVASGSTTTLQYSCIAPGIYQLPAPSSIDYSVVNATTLQLIYTDGSGHGSVYTYTKQ